MSRVPVTESITAERLRELYTYDCETGVFRRRVKTGKSTIVGEVVGSPAKNGYLRITVDNVRVLAHRAAMLYVYGVMPPDDVDHIDGGRQNNRIANLRNATRSENMQNERKGRRGSASGLLGVSWHKGAEKWVASVRIPGGGKYKYLGLFESKEEAHAVYLAEKRRVQPFATI